MRTRWKEICVPLSLVLMLSLEPASATQVSTAQASVAPVSMAPVSMAQASMEAPRGVSDILRSYVDDFRCDRFAGEPMVFGVVIPDKGKWHVRVTGKKSGDIWGVELGEGLPEKPTFVYRIEEATLRGIDRGELNALTAQGKAWAGDYTPMSITFMEGFEPSMEAYAAINPFSFHFWTRGFPEIIPYGEGLTRRAHGSNFVVFYYETGIRTAWYRVLPGERVRDGDPAAPFPMLVIATRGTTRGKVDGVPVTISGGEAVFIPANAEHVWWNDADVAAEAVLIMFGDGA